MLEKNIPKELEKLHMHDLLLSPKDAVRVLDALTARFSDLQELDIEELVSNKQPEWADTTRTIDVDQRLIKRAIAQVNCSTFAYFAQISGRSRPLIALLSLDHRIWRFAHCFTQ